jgi:hypothetical protein
MVTASNSESNREDKSMSEKGKTQEHAAYSKTGVIRRTNVEPSTQRDPERPTTLPELHDEGSTTGVLPVITEGEDRSAERDNDVAAGS